MPLTPSLVDMFARCRRTVCTLMSSGIGDLRGSATGRQEAEDFALANAHRARLEPADGVIDDGAGDAAVEIPVTPRDGADGFDQLARLGALHEVPGGAGCQSLADRLRVAVHRQHDDPQVRFARRAASGAAGWRRPRGT